MAHNIEYNKVTRRHSFYSLKEVAWHRLGQVVKEAVSPQEAMHLAGLDYEVGLGELYCNMLPVGTKRTAQLENAIACYDEGDMFIGYVKKRNAKCPNSFGVYRKDNGRVFGSVGSRYTPIQNSEALDFIYEVSKCNEGFKKEDVIIETAGALYNGEQIFVTAKLPSIDIGKDQMDRYILFNNSHDGSSSLRACFTSVRVVCNNTLNAALRACSNKVAFMHTTNIHKRLEEAANTMRQAYAYNEALKEALSVAQGKQITNRDKFNFIYNLTLTSKQKDYLKDVGGLSKLKQGDDVISTRKQNIINGLLSNIESGVGQDVYEGTAYWLYNGVTTYLQNDKTYKNDTEKFQDINYGSGAKLSQAAFDQMLTLMR